MSAGKGDKPRSCFSKKFKNNYDEINWGHPIDIHKKLNIIPFIQGPRNFEIIDCSHKIHSSGGCTSCWSCKQCGKSGCDNFYFMDFQKDTLKTVECEAGKVFDIYLEGLSNRLSKAGWHAQAIRILSAKSRDECKERIILHCGEDQIHLL